MAKRRVNGLIRSHEKVVFKNIILFTMLTIGFHFFFRYWAGTLDYFPIKDLISEIYKHLSKAVFTHSAFVVDAFMEVSISYPEQKLSFKNNGFITINSGCSGLKQMFQFLIVFIFCKGKFLRKVIYFSGGILLIHLTNIFRIVSLSVILVYREEFWNFSHDYLFRPLFYILIFTLWLFWVEKFILKNHNKNFQ